MTLYFPPFIFRFKRKNEKFIKPHLRNSISVSGMLHFLDSVHSPLILNVIPVGLRFSSPANTESVSCTFT
jgi:hypothetical protein